MPGGSQTPIDSRLLRRRRRSLSWLAHPPRCLSDCSCLRRKGGGVKGGAQALRQSGGGAHGCGGLAPGGCRIAAAQCWPACPRTNGEVALDLRQALVGVPTPGHGYANAGLAGTVDSSHDVTCVGGIDDCRRRGNPAQRHTAKQRERGNKYGLQSGRTKAAATGGSSSGDGSGKGPPAPG